MNTTRSVSTTDMLSLQNCIVIGENPRIRQILNKEYKAPFDYNSFKEFASTKLLVSESILFHEAFSTLKHKNSNEENVTSIMNEFIREGAVQELNIPVSLRKVALKKVEEILQVIIDISNNIDHSVSR
jgi:hypothetical protein